jgi:hypothetical protein
MPAQYALSTRAMRAVTTLLRPAFSVSTAAHSPKATPYSALKPVACTILAQRADCAAMLSLKAAPVSPFTS